MTWLVTIGLTNAVLAALLAAGAYAIGRWARRPALTHVLWVLVLIKLLTPPVFNVPIGLRIDSAAWSESWAAAEIEAKPSRPELALPVPPTGAVISPVVDDSAATRGAAAVPSATPVPAAVERARVRPVAAALRVVSSPANWLLAAVAVWIAGSAAMGGLFWTRTRRFQRYLMLAARPAAELDARLAELARSARLSAWPRVVTVESTISPMLFGVGRGVVLIFPAALNRQLHPAARDTLLLHELAHYARGDHWVRLIELVAQVLFWWHPVVWWARRELEAAEEECCDAWVVERQAGVPRLYAEALLATIDFLCAQPAALPPVACGLGDVPLLRLRLTQIIRGRLPAQLCPATKSAVFLAAVFILPLGPALFGAATTASPSVAEAPDAETATPEVVLAEAPRAIATALPVPQPVQPAALAANGKTPTMMAVAALLPKPQKSLPVYGTAVSPDGRYKLQVRPGFQVALTDTDVISGGFRVDFTQPLMRCVAFSPDPDSRTFAAGFDDSRVRLYESESGRHITTLQGGAAPIRSVAFSPDGKRLAAGAADGSAVLWDVESGEPSTLLGSQAAPVNCIRWSQDDRRLAISVCDEFGGPDSSSLIICSAQDGSVLAQFALPEPVGAIEWLADDRAILLADYHGNGTVWHLANGLALAHVPLVKAKVSAAQWSPDCPLLQPGELDQLLSRAMP